jgi:uncharacterized protein (TIGR00369 family)
MSDASIPYADLLGVVADETPEGLLFRLPYHSTAEGRPGFLHGGAIAGLLEIAAISTLVHSLGDGITQVKPVNITIDFMRGGRERETYARAVLSRVGKSIANVEVHAWQTTPDVPIASARLNLKLHRDTSAS